MANRGGVWLKEPSHTLSFRVIRVISWIALLGKIILSTNHTNHTKRTDDPNVPGFD